MQVNVLQAEKGILKIELKGESQTLTHLIANVLQEKGIDAAAVREHPFMADPKIVVRGSKSAVKNACIKVQKLCDEFDDEFRKAIKK